MGWTSKQHRRNDYLKNKDRYVQDANNRRVTNRQVIDHAKGIPCSDCGIKFEITEVMDFDHVRGEKLFNISSRRNSGISVLKLLAEIAKCDVVCSNCHRIRTFLRRQEQV